MGEEGHAHHIETIQSSLSIDWYLCAHRACRGDNLVLQFIGHQAKLIPLTTRAGVKVMSRRKLLVTPSSLAIGGLVTSCTLLPVQLFPPPPDDLPDSLQFVIDSKELFRETETAPLADVDAGTVIGDLSTLSGCWGNYLGTTDGPSQEELQGEVNSELPFPIQPPVVSQDRLRVDVYLSMEFDPISEQVTQWILFDYFAGYGVLVGGTRSSYTISGPNRIEGVDLQDYSSVAEDGGPNPNNAVVMEGLPSLRQFSYDWQATISGDYLKIRFAAHDPPEPDDVLIYRRFECPIGE